MDMMTTKTFTYEPVDGRYLDTYGSHVDDAEVDRLRGLNTPFTVYRITIYDENGLHPHAEAAHALHIPLAGRTAIAWGAEAMWADSTGDIEQDIELWLNDPDEWEARN